MYRLAHFIKVLSDSKSLCTTTHMTTYIALYTLYPDIYLYDKKVYLIPLWIVSNCTAILNRGVSKI